MLASRLLEEAATNGPTPLWNGYSFILYEQEHGGKHSHLEVMKGIKCFDFIWKERDAKCTWSARRDNIAFIIWHRLQGLCVHLPVSFLLSEVQEWVYDLALQRKRQCGHWHNTLYSFCFINCLRDTDPHQLLSSCVLHKPGAVAWTSWAVDSDPWRGEKDWCYILQFKQERRRNVEILESDRLSCIVCILNSHQGFLSP